MTAPDTPRRRRPNIYPALIIIALVALVIEVGLIFRPEPASSPLPSENGDIAPVETPFDATAAESTVWQLLNGARINLGLPPLIMNDTLMSIARWRSQDLVQRNYFSATILGTSYQVDHWYDLEGLEYSFSGENIGWNNGYSDADSPIAVHNGFMNSSGHRVNILSLAFTEAGVGAYGANNVEFLGSLRSPRVYTVLFLAPEPSPGP